MVNHATEIDGRFNITSLSNVALCRTICKEKEYQAVTTVLNNFLHLQQFYQRTKFKIEYFRKCQEL